MVTELIRADPYHPSNPSSISLVAWSQTAVSAMGNFSCLPNDENRLEGRASMGLEIVAAGRPKVAVKDISCKNLGGLRSRAG